MGGDGSGCVVRTVIAVMVVMALIAVMIVKAKLVKVVPAQVVKGDIYTENPAEEYEEWDALLTVLQTASPIRQGSRAAVGSGSHKHKDHKTNS
eukprot:s7691_g2.t1